MCVDNGKGVKIAEKDIVVIKVLLKSGSSIFRDEEGEDCGCFRVGEYLTDFNDMIKKKAIGFNEGFGYTVFKLGADVKCYTDKIQQAYPIACLKFIVRKYKIPKGSRYEEGKIANNLLGSGLEAIRCEQLKKVRK